MNIFIILLSLALWGVIHSVLASHFAIDMFKGSLGSSAMRLYRLGYNVVGAITHVPVLAITAIEPGPVIYRLPAPISWLFLLGQGAAALLIIVGVLQTDVWHFLGLRQLAESPDPAPARLVTTGLYRYVRHLLYTAGLLFLWLTPIMTTTLLVLYGSLSLYLYVGSFFTTPGTKTAPGERFSRLFNVAAICANHHGSIVPTPEVYSPCRRWQVRL